LRRLRGLMGKLKLTVNEEKTRCQIASKSDPFSLARATPSEGAKTGVAEPHIAEQSRSWRGASGERGVKRGS
jgi:hypothetical protein